MCRPASWTQSRWTSCPGCPGERSGNRRQTLSERESAWESASSPGSLAWSTSSSSKWSSCHAYKGETRQRVRQREYEGWTDCPTTVWCVLCVFHFKALHVFQPLNRPIEDTQDKKCCSIQLFKAVQSINIWCISSWGCSVSVFCFSSALEIWVNKQTEFWTSEVWGPVIHWLLWISKIHMRHFYIEMYTK